MRSFINGRPYTKADSPDRAFRDLMAHTPTPKYRQLAKTQRRMEALVDLWTKRVIRHGQHDEECAVNNRAVPRPCSCGFEEALLQAKGFQHDLEGQA
jgi:hypothetical protein